MIDLRFYVALGPVSAQALAEAGGGVLADPSAAARLLSDCGPLDEVGPDGLGFCEKPPSGEGPVVTAAGACFVREKDAARLPAGTVAIVCANPRGGFARAARLLYALRRHEPSAPAVDPSAKIEDDVSLGHGCVIGPGAEIGRGTVIGPHAVIGPGVAIGRGCRVGAHASVQCALIGDRVQVSAGCIVGEAGFGVAATPEGPVDVPQLGRVILQDEVTLGSLVAVDRGAFGDTIVGLASKLDNFTQVAHNARLGRGVVVAAFGGISGSCDIGDFVMMGGRVGLADHRTVGAGAQIAAGSGVITDVPAGEVWGGYPAKPRGQWLKETVTLRRMVDAGKKPRDGGKA